MTYLQSGFIFGLGLLLLSCTHLHTKIKKLPYHSSQYETMDKLGRPLHINRQKGLEYWIYKFKIRNRQYTKAVIFKNGFSLKTGKLKAYPDPERLLDEAEDFKEYEEAVRHYQKNRVRK